MLAPADIGVRRGDNLSDVIGAIKGVVYYGDMVGFGEPSSFFTRGMPGLRPLGVNYFIKTGATCSNGAEMWDYVRTIPDGSALGDRIKNEIRRVGLPQMRGMAPGALEDAKAALNPAPVINAVIGSGYPQCRLMKLPVGDFDGQINNRDGNLIVDPEGLLYNTREKRFYQEKWIQDRIPPPVRKPGETDLEHFLRGDPVMLDYDTWDAVPKIYAEDGCLKEKGEPKDASEPTFCAKAKSKRVIQLPDKTKVEAVDIEGFTGYSVIRRGTNESHLKLAVSVVALLGLCAFWSRR